MRTPDEIYASLTKMRSLYRETIIALEAIDNPKSIKVTLSGITEGRPVKLPAILYGNIQRKLQENALQYLINEIEIIEESITRLEQDLQAALSKTFTREHDEPTAKLWQRATAVKTKLSQ